MPRGTESPSTPVSCCGNGGGGEAVIDADLYIPFTGGRLTLESGVPISFTDQTAKTTLYYTPYINDKISLYAAPDWELHTFTERSLSLAGLAANTNFDIFIYNNAGTLTLESVAWSTDTARATALATQDGIYVKTGELNKKFLGTIRTTSVIGQCEDSLLKRFISNYYNHTERNLRLIETTDSWTYNVNTWRYARAQSTNRLEFVLSNPKLLKATVSAAGGGSGATASIGVGVDVNNANSAQIIGRMGGTTNLQVNSHYSGMIQDGFHYAAWVEITPSGTITFYGDSGVPTTIQSGIFATLSL